MCVRMAQSVLSMTVALSAFVRQGTKEHTVTVSKQTVMCLIQSLVLTLPKVKDEINWPDQLGATNIVSHVLCLLSNPQN